MLYSEFIEGTGCRENDHNYQVYKNLEIMYMNSDMTKDQIYEYGKKLVDNSKTPEEIRFEAEKKEEIKSLKEEIEYYKSELDRYKTLLQYENESSSPDQEFIKHCKHMIKCNKNWISERRNKIQVIKNFFLK